MKEDKKKKIEDNDENKIDLNFVFEKINNEDFHILLKFEKYLRKNIFINKKVIKFNNL
jgi:hypothetical protein